MTHVSRIASALAALLVSVGAHAQSGGALVLRVYDFAGVEKGRLADALRDARDIFSTAGVPSEWHDCTRGAKSAAAPCATPRRPDDPIVRIVRRDQKDDGLPRALGVSVVGTGRGVLATVFLDLIEPVAQRTKTDAHALLGRAIAHEVGHLLLGTRDHSETGLMRGIWTAHEITRNEESDWLFGPADEARLRASRTGVTPPPAASFATGGTDDAQEGFGR